MKKIIASIIIFIITQSTFGQKVNQLNTMIGKCLETYYSTQVEEAEQGLKPAGYLSNLHILYDYFPQFFVFPDTLKSKVINNGYVIRFLQKTKGQKQLFLIKFNGAKLVKNRLTLQFSEYHITTSRKGWYTEVSIGSTRFIYEYSCEKREWELTETQVE